MFSTKFKYLVDNFIQVLPNVHGPLVRSLLKMGFGRSLSGVWAKWKGIEGSLLRGNPSSASRSISDHSPIKRYSLTVNCGPQPFSFENCLLLHKDFHSFGERLVGVDDYPGFCELQNHNKISIFNGKTLGMEQGCFW